MSAFYHEYLMKAVYFLLSSVEDIYFGANA